MLKRFQNKGKDKQIESDNTSSNIKLKSKNTLRLKAVLLLEFYDDSRRKKHEYSRDHSEDNYHYRRMNIIPTKRFLESLKRLKH